MKTEHEKILQEGIQALESKGYRVIRLDHRVVPDAIALKGKMVLAVEASTSISNIFLTKRKFNTGSQYDEEVIVTRPFSERFHLINEYNFVIAEYGKHSSYREIRHNFKQKFGKNISVSTIHDWIKGESRPRV